MNALSKDFSAMFEPSEDTTRTLRTAFGQFATGVTVVTCASDQGPVGMTANSFSSLSLDPALVMWAPGKSSRRYEAFAAAGHFAIHVLGADQREICDLFARDGYALKTLPHQLSAEGVPLIRGCLARFECRQHALHPAGDHAIIVGEVLRVGMRPGEALTFFSGKFGQLTQP